MIAELSQQLRKNQNLKGSLGSIGGQSWISTTGKQVKPRSRSSWGLAWVPAKLQNKLEADGQRVLRKGSCDLWESAWFQARLSQAQLTSFSYWKRPLTWRILSLDLSKAFDEVCTETFFTSFTSGPALVR